MNGVLGPFICVWSHHVHGEGETPQVTKRRVDLGLQPPHHWGGENVGGQGKGLTSALKLLPTTDKLLTIFYLCCSLACRLGPCSQ
jgi:hypothetical protein